MIIKACSLLVSKRNLNTMKRSWAHRHLLTRKFVAVAVLCLFIIKGLSFLGITASLAADPLRANPAITAAVLGVHCENAKSKADPSNQHIDYTDCCAFCSSVSKDIVALSANLLLVLVGVSLPQTGIQPKSYFVKNDTSPKPPGWLSGWSSTAPPVA
jgi:hypothetical protein